MDGLLACAGRLERSSMDPVVAAAMIAFGFVFIHPFVDGNGRLHRYLVHHMLARKHFGQQGVVFPVSAALLDQIIDYRKVLEAHSHPLLDRIEWRETEDHNVEVLNDTGDLYRYFDATVQAEFLYRMVVDTIERIIPKVVEELQRRDRMKRFLEEEFNMPNRAIDLLVGFLQQGQGKLSQRALAKEFADLKPKEVTRIESHYQQVFASRSVSGAKPRSRPGTERRRN
jgi:Fic family protein